MNTSTTIDIEKKCYHCGEDIGDKPIVADEHNFCCTGCSTVYELLKDNNLCTYYDLNENAGISLKSKNFDGKYDYLQNPDIVAKLLDFDSESVQKVTLHIPGIHCSSCVWLLENLPKVKAGVYNARLNFVKKSLSISFDPTICNLQEIVELLATLGYEPYISYADSKNDIKKSKPDNHLIRQIAVVGFCMGNIMLLSFPEYFNIQNSSDSSYQKFFLYLNFLLSIPVFFYGGWDYLKGTYINIKSIVKKETDNLSIDIPIAIGITALFVRSMSETFLNQSAGYWDSLSGLIFFLLVGKWAQKRTFDFLTFERTFKSYFPLAVFAVNKGKYLNISELEAKDHIKIGNGEIIPVDGMITKGSARIDYSYVTGESEPTKLNIGDTVYAGGRQLGESIEIEVAKKVDNSYLTELWNDASFEKEKVENNTKLAQAFIKYFTVITLFIALAAGVYWWIMDPSLVWPAVTAVLMVACPCALTLSMPFTMNTVMGILGRNKFFIRSQEVIQQLNEIKTVVFDKTGTLTNTNEQEVHFYEISQVENFGSIVFSLASQSSHPLSKAIANHYQKAELLLITDYNEIHGKGVVAIIAGDIVKIGNSDFCNIKTPDSKASTWLTINNEPVGYFHISATPRTGLKKVLDYFKSLYTIHLLSGDRSTEKSKFERYFGEKMNFKQKPKDKLSYVESLNSNGEKVLMIGDGLNDAGALHKSHVGIVISEDTNRFSPACDAILDASAFDKLPLFLNFGKSATRIVKLSFLLSLVYNFFGISWAVSGTLSPVLAAIFMPLSSISVVLFSVGITYLHAFRKGLLNTKSWV